MAGGGGGGDGDSPVVSVGRRRCGHGWSALRVRVWSLVFGGMND